MKSKVCSKCKELKSLLSFTKNKSRSDGLAHHCKVCKKAQRKKYYAENKEKVLKANANFREENPDYMKAYLKNYYLSDKSRFFAYEANRRASKSKATPPWLSREHLSEIKKFYWLAKDLQSVTGEQYHVDHIVPLQGENVCGLHVPWNLQVLPADINLSKGNSYADYA